MKDVQLRLIKQQVQTQQSLLERGWQFDIKPQGGMFIWAYHPELPCLQPLMNTLEKQNILLMPGSAFSVTRDFKNYVRINCTHFSEKMGHYFSV